LSSPIVLPALQKGIVNLFALRQCQGEGEASHLFLPSGGQGWSPDLLPDLESVPHLLPIRGRGKPMSARAEVLGDGTIGREETLGLARGFEPLHTLLPLTGGLVRVLRAIIQRPVLAMFHPREDLSLGGSVALEFIDNDHARYVRQALEELAEELLCCLLIPAVLHQDIQHVPVLTHRPPQIVMFALDCEKHLIEVSPVAELGTAATQLIGILLAKLAAPLANCFVGHDDAAFQQ
jgi:hypothetical protein